MSLSISVSVQRLLFRPVILKTEQHSSCESIQHELVFDTHLTIAEAFEGVHK